MFKMPVLKFLHISLAMLLVFALAIGTSGVQVARAQEALSEGCAWLAFFHSVGPFGPDFAVGFAVFAYSAGETVSFTLGEPSTGAPQTVSLEEVIDNIVLDTTLFPGTVSYEIPSNGDYAFGFSLDQGTATWDVNCVAAPQAGPVFVVNASADTDDGVCGLLPSNNCTLREAINAANAQSGSNTITFDTAGVFATPQTITIALTLPAITDPDGLTIDGSGADVTLSGNNAAPVNHAPVMFVGLGAALNLNALTIADGNNTCDNVPPACTPLGGGIVNQGMLTITNSTFSDNSAAFGGGIVNHSTGTLTITDSTFSGNSSSGAGGGVYNLSVLDVTNSTFSGNSASGSGGGIYNDSTSTLTITGSAFSGNDATSGGGIYSSQGELTLANNIFSDNVAQVGGGIYNDEDGTLTITDNTFSGNSATGTVDSKDGLGGGIYNASTLTVTNSTFDGNTAKGFTTADTPGNGYGGAIYTSGPITISNSTLSANQAFGGDNNGDSCNPSTECLVGYGRGAGGAIYIESGSGHSIVNATFSDNVVRPGSNTYINTPAGGALFMVAGSMDLKNSILANSNAANDCHSGGTVNQTNNLIESPYSFCGAPALTSDPMLDALADNGGPTQTMALLAGSPAIDAGDDATCAAAPVSNLDQRGVTRPQGPHCDIGAYEAADTTQPSVTIDQASSQADPTMDSPINFTVVFSESVTGFDGTDVDLSASTAAGALSASVTGGPATYNVTVSGMTGAGDVVAFIPANAATDGGSNGNTASTSTDNSVTFVVSSPTTLLYNGAQVASLGNNFQTAAKLSSPSAACVSDQTVSFSLDANPLTGAAGAYTLGTAITNSSGQATLSISTTGWQEGIYMITASFSGTSNCDPSSDTTILTAAAAGNSASGGGWYTLPGSGRNNFGFNIRKVDNKCRTNCAYKGQLLFMNNGKWKLKGTLDTYVKSSTGIGTASGIGDLYWWNASLNGGLGDWDLAKSDVAFTISFHDGGSGKKSKTDTFGINIRYTPVPPQPGTLPNSSPTLLKGGDIKVQ